VSILAGIGFLYVFKLSNQRKRSFGTLSSLRKRKRFSIRRERKVIIIAVFHIRGTALWVAPDAVFQNVIPYIATTRFSDWRVGSNKTGFQRVGITVFVHAEYFDTERVAFGKQFGERPSIGLKVLWQKLNAS
jgi:hypothetical protein